MLLTIEHEGFPFMGCLLVSDESFCRQLAQLLQSYRGRSIREVGGMDIGFTL
jgi:hypothetical protein